MDLQIQGQGTVRWPFPVDYDKVNNMDADVLVIGAGAAGSSAGIAAARAGATVIVCEKGASKRAGNCGAGIDHWNDIPGSPKASKTIDERANDGTMGRMNRGMLGHKGPAQTHRDYIAEMGTWEALFELEKMGLPIRDTDGDFDGLSAQDSDTHLLKAYNYAYMDSVRLRGGNFIMPVLNKELKKSGATVIDRIMITALLNDRGRQGGRICGAVGFSQETGEFYVIRAKAVIIASGYVCGNWIYSAEITGNSYRWDPNDTGDGHVMAYLAGAKTVSFFSNGNAGESHPFAWPRFGVGSNGNTWFPCSIVDNNGKPVPWEYADGSEAKDFEERINFKKNGPSMPRNLMEAVRRGEYELPFWADLGSVPEKERRLIWGMMIGNEGKTRYTLYDYYTRCGFNPERHMLMCPVDPQKGLGSMHGDAGSVRQWRTERGGQGELVVDWDMMTSIQGLFAAGASSGLEGCSYACSSGAYAGKRAAEFASKNQMAAVSQNQIAAEKERIYAPAKRCGSKDAFVSWKELWGGSSRVMQQCCGEYLSESTLKLGLEWMESICQNEAQQTFARNPHELARVMECENRLNAGKLYMNACLALLQMEKEHSEIFDENIKPAGSFKNKTITSADKLTCFLNSWLEEGTFRSEISPSDYYLKAPYADTLEENYKMHSLIHVININSLSS